MKKLYNKVFDEINVGDSASLKRTLSKQDIQLFALVTGDMNPAHLDESYAKTDMFCQIVGHGMWTGSMFSTLFAMQLPGPGTIYLSQTLNFLHPVLLNQTVEAKITVLEKDPATKRVKFQTICIDSQGKKLLEGEATVLAPTKKASFDLSSLEELPKVYANHHFDEWLIEKTRKLAPLKTAVVHPVDDYSLEGAVKAAAQGVIEPILVGPKERIQALAKKMKLDIDKFALIPTPHSNAAAEKAVAMANSGEVEAIMKGKLHTDELMSHVVEHTKGLRTGRRMSHVFTLDVPRYPKPLFLTDAAINIAPTLMEKRDIVQNAVDLFHAINDDIMPRVAILSAVETVNEKIPSTLDATALCKMAERKQITGCYIDGPLAFDNAISEEAAEIKGIQSEVAGKADILVVPDVESGNMLYKQLRYFSGAQGAGVVLGAKVPIILTSRAADSESRVSSCALALLYTRNRRS